MIDEMKRSGYEALFTNFNDEETEREREERRDDHWSLSYETRIQIIRESLIRHKTVVSINLGNTPNELNFESR